MGGHVRGSRDTALDGLRGIAAVVVVVHHCLLVDPVVAAVNEHKPVEVHGWQWWALRSPLTVLSAGPEAVTVFFVLSGYVLCLPMLSSSRPRWRDYYPQRLVRLYLPTTAAFLLALGLALVATRAPQPYLSAWINSYAHQTSISELVVDVVTMSSGSRLNGVVWSLRYEVLFSLLLPLYLLVARWLSRFPLVVLVLACAFTAVGAVTQVAVLSYLSLFVVGVLFAARRDWLAALADRPAIARGVLAAAGLAAIWAARLVEATPAASRVVALLGAAAIVATFIHSPAARRLGDSAAAQWLGRRSFSLYLVHVPIIVTVAFAARSTNPLVVGVIVAPAVAALTVAFFAGVERPSHRLVREIKRRGALATSP